MELNCGENKSKMPKKKVWKQEKFEKSMKNCDSFYYVLKRKSYQKLSHPLICIFSNFKKKRKQEKTIQFGGKI